MQTGPYHLLGVIFRVNYFRILSWFYLGASWSGLKKSQGEMVAPEPGGSGLPFALAAWTRPALRLAASPAAAPSGVKEIQSASSIRRLLNRSSSEFV